MAAGLLQQVKQVKAGQRFARRAAGALAGRGTQLFRHFFREDDIGAFFCRGNSPRRNFASIFFKIAGKVKSFLPLFAIKNLRDQLVTSTNMVDCVLEKNQNGRKN